MNFTTHPTPRRNPSHLRPPRRSGSALTSFRIDANHEALFIRRLSFRISKNMTTNPTLNRINAQKRANTQPDNVPQDPRTAVAEGTGFEDDVGGGGVGDGPCCVALCCPDNIFSTTCIISL